MAEKATPCVSSVASLYTIRSGCFALLHRARYEVFPEVGAGGKVV